MNKLKFCSELRCLGFDPRPTQTGVLVSYHLPISRENMERVLKQVGVEGETEKVESNMWLIKLDKSVTNG